MQGGFSPDPNHPSRIGYLTSFNGLGLRVALANDLLVPLPPYYTSKPTYTPLTITADNKVHVAGIMDKISWSGAPGDPVAISCYVSTGNSTLLRLLSTGPLKTTKIQTIGWWIGNYDPGPKKPFEQFFPFSPQQPGGQLNTVSGVVRLNASSSPVSPVPGADVSVYNVYLEVLPTAGQVTTLKVATSSSQVLIKNWGI